MSEQDSRQYFTFSGLDGDELLPLDAYPSLSLDQFFDTNTDTADSSASKKNTTPTQTTNYFFINNIGFSLLPENISFIKDTVFIPFNTLRHKGESLLKDGFGSLGLSIKMTFVPHMSLGESSVYPTINNTIIRLLRQVKRYPFCTIESNLLLETFPETPITTWICSGIQLSIGGGAAPGTVEGKLNFEYFNTDPYVPNPLFFKSWKGLEKLDDLADPEVNYSDLLQYASYLKENNIVASLRQSEIWANYEELISRGLPNLTTELTNKLSISSLDKTISIKTGEEDSGISLTHLGYSFNTSTPPITLLGQHIPTRQFVGGIQEKIFLSVVGHGEGVGSLHLSLNELHKKQKTSLRSESFINDLTMNVEYPFLQAIGINKLFFQGESRDKDSPGVIDTEMQFLVNNSFEDDTKIFKYSNYVGSADPMNDCLSEIFKYIVANFPVLASAAKAWNKQKDALSGESLSAMAGMDEDVLSLASVKSNIAKYSANNEELSGVVKKLAERIYEGIITGTNYKGGILNACSILGIPENKTLLEYYKEIGNATVLASSFVPTLYGGLDNEIYYVLLKNFAKLYQVPDIKNIIKKYNKLSTQPVVETYPDLVLPPNPLTGMAYDTDPNFVWMDYSVVKAAEEEANGGDFSNFINWLAVKDRTLELLNFTGAQLDKQIGNSSWREVQGEQAASNKSAPGLGDSGGSLSEDMEFIYYADNTTSTNISGNTTVFDIEKSIDLLQKHYKSSRSIKRAFPSYRVSFIEEDMFGEETTGNKVIFSSDDFYSVASVASIKVTRSKYNPVNTAVISFIDPSGILVSPLVENTKIEEDNSPGVVDTEQENEITKGIAREGIKVELRYGYSNNSELLPTKFVGYVAGVETNGNEVRVVCFSYGEELTYNELDNEVSQQFLSETQKLSGKNYYRSTQRILTWTLAEEWEEAEAKTHLLHFGHIDTLSGVLIKDRFSNTKILNESLLASMSVTKNNRVENIFSPSYRRGEEMEMYFNPTQMTPWDIVQDLTRRHPGYCAGVMPYRDVWGPRVTLFFGRPDMPYIYRAPTPYEYALERSNTTKFVDKGVSLLSVIRDETRKQMKQNGTLESRLKPFRQYHLITDKHDIIDCDILTTTDGVANALNIFWNIEQGGDGSSPAEVKLDSGMTKECDIRWGNVQENNAYTERMAEFYGMSNLMLELKQSYKGDIVILGNENINPFDILVINDQTTGIEGAVEVGETTDFISRDTGYITSIKPELVTCAGTAEGAFAIAIAMTEALTGSSWRYRLLDEAEKNVYNTSPIIKQIPSIIANTVSKNQTINSLVEVNLNIAYNTIKTMIPFKLPKSIQSKLEGAINDIYVFCSKYSSAKRDPVLFFPLNRDGEPMISGLGDNERTGWWASFRGQLAEFDEEFKKTVADQKTQSAIEAKSGLWRFILGD